MDQDRAMQLENPGMIWSHFDVAWEEGLTAARGWAAEHGHPLAPLDATHQGYRGRPRWISTDSSRRTAVTNLPKQRGLSPVNGPIQDGSDAVITPATSRSSQLPTLPHAIDPVCT